jgi:transcriptional regulator with XRE-family HTH domain
MAKWRNLHGMTIREVAEELGISPGHVHRIEARALRKLRIGLGLPVPKLERKSHHVKKPLNTK